MIIINSTNSFIIWISFFKSSVKINLFFLIIFIALFSDGSEILSAFTTTPKEPDPIAYSYL